MKAKQLFAAALAVLTVGFISCKGEKSNDAEYKLDKTQATIAVGETVQFSVVPTATAEWSSNKPEIATVDANGLVKGISVGNAIITAKVAEQELSAMVIVTAQQSTVDPGSSTPVIDQNLHASLKGTEYYLFVLDGTTADKLKGRIKADYRPDDQTKFIDVWNSGETYEAGTTNGLNFYGEAEGWTAFTVVAPGGWSGGGIRATADGAETPYADNKLLDEIMKDPASYYFHIGMKSTDQASHHFRLYGTTEVDLSVGADGETKDFDGGAIDVTFKRDGEWQEIEVPMTAFTNKGLVFNSTAKSNFYVLGWTSGGQVGASLQIDACFIYKK